MWTKLALPRPVPSIFFPRSHSVADGSCLFINEPFFPIFHSPGLGGEGFFSSARPLPGVLQVLLTNHTHEMVWYFTLEQPGIELYWKTTGNKINDSNVEPIEGTHIREPFMKFSFVPRSGKDMYRVRVGNAINKCVNECRRALTLFRLGHGLINKPSPMYYSLRANILLYI